MPRAMSSSNTRVASSREAPGSMRAGISSARTSSRYSLVRPAREAEAAVGAAFEVESTTSTLFFYLSFCFCFFFFTEQRKSQTLTTRDVLRRTGAGEIAHPLHHRDAVGHGNGAARVEHVEAVRALERRLVRRQHEPLLEAALRLALPPGERRAQEVDVGD